MQNPQQYFIAIVCPEPLQQEITAIKNYFFEKYNCKVALKSPAHITLIPPFELKHHTEHELSAILTDFKSGINTLHLSINGYGHFEKRTVFLQPESNPDIMQLQADLQTYLKQKLFHIKTQQHYHPHITVANRDIKPHDFDMEWKIFCSKEFNSTFICDNFSLLKLTDKKWNVITDFIWKET